jgi:hypothetical protein
MMLLMVPDWFTIGMVKPSGTPLAINSSVPAMRVVNARVMANPVITCLFSVSSGGSWGFSEQLWSGSEGIAINYGKQR